MLLGSGLLGAFIRRKRLVT
ncbi:MAG TPA: hypothetical protein DD723_02365 [Candidatus Omnitrophica bacterium]|nr:hypothetical protein [Candidatus Omnitrophota bacterium]